MHHLVTMHHKQIYFIHISILTKYSDQVQPRSHFYNLSIAHNVHTPPILITESSDWVYLIEGVMWIYIPEVYIPMTCSASILALWWYYPDMISHPVGLHLVILSRHDLTSCRPSPSGTIQTWSHILSICTSDTIQTWSHILSICICMLCYKYYHNQVCSRTIVIW